MLVLIRKIQSDNITRGKSFAGERARRPDYCLFKLAV